MNGQRARSTWVVLAVGLVGCGSLSASRRETMTFEETAIFHPTRYPEGDWETKATALQDAWFDSADGVRLHGWYAEARNPRAVVLFAHGNAGSIADRRWVLDLFRDRLEASVLVFDYRGYGRSGGTPSERGVLADARAARRWLADRAGTEEAGLVLAGESLGGGVAVDLAAKDGARGLVLINTFSSLPDVASSHFRPLPARLLMTTRLDSVAK
ncbi:MAG TPA: alpha/beta hydrolase, partial [Isosphaeraceae bacterium]